MALQTRKSSLPVCVCISEYTSIHMYISRAFLFCPSTLTFSPIPAMLSDLQVDQQEPNLPALLLASNFSTITLLIMPVRSTMTSHYQIKHQADC